MEAAAITTHQMHSRASGFPGLSIRWLRLPFRCLESVHPVSIRSLMSTFTGQDSEKQPARVSAVRLSPTWIIRGRAQPPLGKGFLPEMAENTTRMSQPRPPQMLPSVPQRGPTGVTSQTPYLVVSIPFSLELSATEMQLFTKLAADD